MWISSFADARGPTVFLNTMSAASTLANIEGLKSVGCDMFSAVIHENRIDARTLLLTNFWSLIP